MLRKLGSGRTRSGSTGSSAPSPTTGRRSSMSNATPQAVAALYAAASEGRVETVLEVTRREPGAARVSQADGSTPLSAACMHGHVACVEALLPVSILATGRGKTPLHFAAQAGQTDVCHLLVSAKRAWLEERSIDETGWTPLSLAASEGHLSVVTFLLESGADVNATRNDGSTALSCAAASGCLPVVRALMAAGAQANVAMSDKSSPLYAAALHGRVDVMSALLEAGASVSAVAENGATVLHAAAQGSIEAVQLALSAGADVRAARVDGATALHVAAMSGHVEAAKVLLAAQANVDALMTNGRTPLHLASAHGHLEVVRILVLSSADLERVDSAGFRPLHAAAAASHFVVVSFLLERGADSMAKTPSGQTAGDLSGTGSISELFRRDSARRSTIV